MEQILVKLADEFYLLDADMSRMAKDLPENTLVFCLDEVHMNDPEECIRRSWKTDHCYGCQPLVASTQKIEGLLMLDKIQIEKDFDSEKTLWKCQYEMMDEFTNPEEYLNVGWGDGTPRKKIINNCVSIVPIE